MHEFVNEGMLEEDPPRIRGPASHRHQGGSDEYRRGQHRAPCAHPERPNLSKAEDRRQKEQRGHEVVVADK